MINLRIIDPFAVTYTHEPYILYTVHHIYRIWFFPKTKIRIRIRKRKMLPDSRSYPDPCPSLVITNKLEVFFAMSYFAFIIPNIKLI